MTSATSPATEAFPLRADSHVHVSQRWYEPVEVLLFQMKRAGIDQAVLVQFIGELDNRYMLEVVKTHPDRFRAVVGLAEQRPDVAEQLVDLAEQGATGVRLRPGSRSPGPDPLKLWRTAEELGLAISCAGSSADFRSEDFLSLLARVPDLKVVLEHLGEKRKLNPGFTVESAQATYEAIKEHRNVSVKVHGLGEASDRAPGADGTIFKDPAAHVLRTAFRVLGPDRLMWASDWPASSGREGYLNTLAYPEAVLRHEGATASEIDSVFGGLARSVFQLT